MADSTKIAVRQASEPDLPQLLSLYDELHPDDHGILSVDAASTIAAGIVVKAWQQNCFGLQR